MKRIAIDMDEVMADFTKKHLALFNADYNEAITLEDLQGKKLRDLRPHLVDEIREYLKDPTYFRDLDVMKDAQEVIKELSESFEIYIATAAMHFPSSFTAKYEWLQEHFPFLDDQHFVFCGDKSVIKADYLIDDNVYQLERFTGEGILFTAPHNIHEDRFIRVNSWANVRDYFLK
ncbi:5' nucleotidase, NT5C type [Shouchella lehensis]|uniref:5'(3')-deoxyribonucleotidase n=2 Tax=Shouchella lehensis TaxID=300825 RepID=A0A060LN55_9BACI|nr:5'-3'-deoxyribonucleotidase [Shouchella lehensis]AIC92816.1 5'(3')-deoxyribonucleotidase [Shouchella lehensis G1]MBG9783363.1 5'-3'-deoxyribonucleotidase [Shouchella lehensis]RQW22435.1 5'-3'-deoxyribonucleotidase [Bacillus sp. C1-1]TES49252.1 5'-3'-deoxyribonucleotidase [Shouchella lehensis]